MRRLVKSTLGVTLLEVMLVLAIVAIIVVMSVRYYSSASAAQQAVAAVEQVQAIAAAADTYAASKKYNYDGLPDMIWTLLPRNGNMTPWGSRIVVSGGGPFITIVVPNIPPEICSLIRTNLAANQRLISTNECSTTAATDLRFNYSRIGR